MRKWVVTLPGPQNYNLESDTPAEDLAAMGYSAFGLMELDKAAIKRWWKYPPVPRIGSGKEEIVSQNNIAQAVQPNHTLSLKHLRILAELMAQERGAELTEACAVTPAGEKIDLLHTARCAAGART